MPPLPAARRVRAELSIMFMFAIIITSSSSSSSSSSSIINIIIVIIIVSIITIISCTIIIIIIIIIIIVSRAQRRERTLALYLRSNSRESYLPRFACLPSFRFSAKCPKAARQKRRVRPFYPVISFSSLYIL